MPRKILVIGLPVESTSVTHVNHAVEAPSLFDFEIVIADIDSVLPPVCSEKCPVDEYMEVKDEEYFAFAKLIERLFKEATYLLSKGGLLVCVMKPKRGLSRQYFDKQRLSYSHNYASNYQWVPIENLGRLVEYGSGKGIKICDAKNVFDGYLQMKETFWTAFFKDVDNLGVNYKIVGLNDASKPVAVEFSVEKGVINFQPRSSHPNSADILIGCSVDFFRKTEELPPPTWITDITVPNEVADRKQFAVLTGEISKLRSTSDNLNEKIQKETRIKKLLYEKHETLENVVKESFEELGFVCEKKDDKDWMISSKIGKGILEVTGSDNTIDVQKFRQLLNYLLDENKESGDEKKAILVANHFPDLPVERRGEPFTEKAVAESKVHSICLMPTSELFNLICNLRLGKITVTDIQKRIFETVGIFSA